MMPSRRLLLLSNSVLHCPQETKKSSEPWLEWCWPNIVDFLGPITKVLFIPFAPLTSWDEATERLQNAIKSRGNSYQVTGIHRCASMKDAIAETEAIMVSGGNTFRLLYELQKNDLIDAIRQRVLNDGIRYIGWSAGTNVATPNIKTTNDMPIIWPEKDSALNLFPYNINPHFTRFTMQGFAGETRIQRLEECFKLNRQPIILLPEGTGIKVDGDKFQFFRGASTNDTIEVMKPIANDDKPQYLEYKFDHLASEWLNIDIFK